jgi:hypothetical protein
MLSDLWRWRRRGGAGWADEDAPMWMQALQSLQGVGAQAPEGDEITSSLLDRLPMTNAEKAELGGSMQKLAIAGIQGSIWGTLGLLLVVMALLNFARG